MANLPYVTTKMKLMHNRQLLLAFFTFNLEKAFSTSCPKPENGDYITWTSCSKEPNKWFGLTSLALQQADASYVCSKSNAILVSDWNFNIDRCVTDILVDETVLSGKTQQAWLGATYHINRWLWSDNEHSMTSFDDYNRCKNVDLWNSVEKQN